MLAQGSSKAAPLELQVGGVFDVEEAQRLAEIIARVAPWEPVRVHFHHVRQFHDHVLAILARELSAPYGRNIRLVGLSRHHDRMLRYMVPAG
jgi:hypothetical protein